MISPGGYQSPDTAYHYHVVYMNTTRPNFVIYACSIVWNMQVSARTDRKVRDSLSRWCLGTPKCNSESQYYTIALYPHVGANESTTGCPPYLRAILSYLVQSRSLLLLWNNRNKSNNKLLQRCTTVAANIWKILCVSIYYLSLKQRPQISSFCPARKRNIIGLEILEESWGSFLYLFVIIDQSHHVLPRLFEKILLHTLPYVMMKESSFLVHQVVLPGEHRPSVSHSCVVADHHHCPVRFCQITARDGCGRLIINTYLRMHLFLFFLFSNKLLKLFRIKFCLHGESFIFIT